jgi:hypothetical protein
MTEVTGFKHVTAQAMEEGLRTIDRLGYPGMIQGCYAELEQVLIPGFKFSNYDDDEDAIAVQDEITDAVMMLMTAYTANSPVVSMSFRHYVHTCFIHGATRIVTGLPQLN